MGLLELRHQLYGGVHIQQVVVAECLPVVLREEATQITVESALLMGVFPVAEGSAGSLEHGEHLGMTTLADPSTDGGIIA